MARNQNPSAAASSLDASADQIAAIPLVEERMSVSKRQVESGRVRVHVTVEEREDTITQQLCRDDVQVEHVPKNIRVTEVPHVRLEGNTTVIPVVEETVVVEKVLMLVEEIHVRRRTNSETVEIPVTVRSERARVERQSPSDGTSTATAE
jgi:uncharacterized protein (TIGR02271 family)